MQDCEFKCAIASLKMKTTPVWTGDVAQYLVNCEQNSNILTEKFSFFKILKSSRQAAERNTHMSDVDGLELD